MASDVLFKLLQHEDIKGRNLPIFFAVNKFDKNEASNCSEWATFLDLAQITDQ